MAGSDIDDLKDFRKAALNLVEYINRKVKNASVLTYLGFFETAIRSNPRDIGTTIAVSVTPYLSALYADDEDYFLELDIDGLKDVSEEGKKLIGMIKSIWEEFEKGSNTKKKIKAHIKKTVSTLALVSTNEDFKREFFNATTKSTS